MGPAVANLEVMEEALIASGTQLTTVAMRRLGTGHEGSVLDVLKKHGIEVLPNTAGCHTAAEAVLTAKLAREALGTDLIKVEVVADDHLCYRTRSSCSMPWSLGGGRFHRAAVTRRTTRSWPAASSRRLRGRHAVGRTNRFRTRHPQPAQPRADRRGGQRSGHRRRGIGTASDAALAMELGCDAVMLATRFTRAEKPALMAAAMRDAVSAGRAARLAGRVPRRWQSALASSPTTGLPTF